MNEVLVQSTDYSKHYNTGYIHLFIHTFIHWVSCKVLTSSGTIQRSPSTAPPNISMFRHSHCEEFGVSVFCQVTFIYIAQNHVSQYLSGLYSLHRVRHPLSLDPRFKWNPQRTHIDYEIHVKNVDPGGQLSSLVCLRVASAPTLWTLWHAARQLSE